MASFFITLVIDRQFYNFGNVYSVLVTPSIPDVVPEVLEVQEVPLSDDVRMFHLNPQSRKYCFQRKLPGDEL